MLTRDFKEKPVAICKVRALLNSIFLFTQQNDFPGVKRKKSHHELWYNKKLDYSYMQKLAAMRLSSSKTFEIRCKVKLTVVTIVGLAKSSAVSTSSSSRLVMAITDTNLHPTPPNPSATVTPANPLQTQEEDSVPITPLEAPADTQRHDERGTADAELSSGSWLNNLGNYSIPSHLDQLRQESKANAERIAQARKDGCPAFGNA